MAIAEACACFLDIIERNNTEALGLKAVTVGRYTAAKNSLYAIIVREEERIKERGTLARELKEVANGRKEQLLLDSQTAANDDGLGDAAEQPGLFDPESDQEASKAWTIQSGTPGACRELLIRSVLDGDSRTRAIERAKSELGLTKFEAEQHWDDLIREGLLTKKGKKIEVRELDQLKAAASPDPEPEQTEAEKPEIIDPPNTEIREEDLVWAEKQDGLETISIAALVAKEESLLTSGDLDFLNREAKIVVGTPPVFFLESDLPYSSEFYHCETISFPVKLLKRHHETERWLKVKANAFYRACIGAITWAEYYGGQGQ